jgi:hypothetical protein
MKPARFHPTSILAGCGLALLAFVALGQAGAASGPSWEYKIVADPSEKDCQQLAGEKWEYAGYLGQGTRGTTNDETLWRRPSK